ncbi:MAG TPA: effector-associated domain EAD1-containing protein, partial [Caldilineaceae bacterium]|nr:effector-associated domain EAD1-containing protein [Caldilineaceae bacterium]
MQAIWKQRPNEPDLWYARFELYRLLGPRRSLVKVYRLSMRLEEQPVRKPGPLWYAMAKEWDWRLRAAAWDTALEVRAAQQQEPRRDPYADRRAKLDELIAGVLKALDEADLKNLERDEARRILPTLRGLLRDLMAAQRSEAGLRQAAEPVSQDALSADMLRQVDLELERWQSDRGLAPLAGPVDRRLPGPAPPSGPADGERRAALRDVLASLYPDEASARRVAAQAGLEVGRISFSAQAVNNWHAILTEAERSDQLQTLIQVVRSEYGANRAL